MFICLYHQRMPPELSLSDFAYGFSPLVEETTKDTVVIDAAGCELLFGSAYELANEIDRRALMPAQRGGLGDKIHLAVAANPDTTVFAARFFSGITFISPGEEQVGLGNIPIAELSPNAHAIP